jgi:hypothetical protein
MAFNGGPLSTIGITPEYLTGLATQTASSGVQQVIGQVWKGSGQSFLGSTGQALAGRLAGSAVNIALNSAFGTSVATPAGLKLDSGRNILATTVTPLVTGAVSAGINEQIQKSLKNAGPFGSTLSSLSTSLVNQATQGITNAIFGAATPGSSSSSATNFKMFPGGGGEPPADYGGSAYTLTDVVFSLKPANQGPQSEGDALVNADPATANTLANTSYSTMPSTAGNPLVNSLKTESMTGVKPGSLYDASRWTTPATGGTLYDPGRWVPLNQKLFGP